MPNSCVRYSKVPREVDGPHMRISEDEPRTIFCQSRIAVALASVVSAMVDAVNLVLLRAGPSEMSRIDAAIVSVTT